MEFKGFGKIPRLSREIIVSEKIDGTNASIYIEDDIFLVGSRTRWITIEDDNYGFARWAYDNKEELLKLGNGHHFGEWWGKGIQRNYGLVERRFSLFNTSRWLDDATRPACCSVVPVLYNGLFSTNAICTTLDGLRDYGSIVAPGFKKPEGVIIYHVAANSYFKKTIEKDEEPKGKNHGG